MKIERINDNKLKIVLSKQDLIDKNIDIHTLNPNSIESQDLFFEILQEIEFYYGFDMGNSQVLLEGVSTSSGGMILTVTKNSATPKHSHTVTKNKPKIKATKKTNVLETKDLIYKFDDFDSICEFINRIKNIRITYENSLYEYNQNYYLVLSCSENDEKIYKKLLFILSDYATFTSNVSIKNKLNEYGNMIIEKNAINQIKKKK